MNSTEPRGQDFAAENAESKPIVSLSEARKLNLIRYYTGVPCKYGHVEERLVSTRGCIECRRERDRNADDKRIKYLSDYEKLNKTKARRSNYRKSDRGAELRRKGERDRYHKEVIASRKSAMKKYDVNKEKILHQKSLRTKKRLKEDPEYKSIQAIRNMIGRVLRLTGNRKIARSESLIGYTKSQLKDHLQRQFSKAMDWGNHGTVWEIDHISPVSLMLKTGEVDPSVINALSNLMPILKSENRSKGDKEIFLL